MNSDQSNNKRTMMDCNFSETIEIVRVVCINKVNEIYLPKNMFMIDIQNMADSAELNMPPMYSIERCWAIRLT